MGPRQRSNKELDQKSGRAVRYGRTCLSVAWSVRSLSPSRLRRTASSTAQVGGLPDATFPHHRIQPTSGLEQALFLSKISGRVGADTPLFLLQGTHDLIFPLNFKEYLLDLDCFPQHYCPEGYGTGQNATSKSFSVPMRRALQNWGMGHSYLTLVLQLDYGQQVLWQTHLQLTVNRC